MILGYIKNGGGTKEAARRIMGAYRGNKEPKPEPLEPSVPPSAVIPAPADLSVSGPEDIERILDMPGEELSGPGIHETAGGNDIDPLAGVEIQPEPVKSPPHHREPISREATNPDHLIIDLQDVFDRIYGYLDRLKKKITDAGAESEEGIIAQYKIDAVYDIVSELHQVKSV